MNALLDFARLEAGRLRASYAPIDVAGVTAELAGMFQSATTAAGVRLVIDCPRLGEPAWIDRDMWEKIVPNLVSNAFKFTLAGEIAVRTRAESERFVLEVADTGVGIPEAELPKIFDRFHRVAGAKGRTHEGSGIGLSLVRELVELHGGRVSVTSAVGHGTTFRVEIPKGFAHLPADAVSQQRAEAQCRPRRRGARGRGRALGTKRPREPGNARGDAASPAEEAGPRPRVLVVDDNADLRDYVAALLAPTYDVATAADGLVALAAVRADPPDIVVSDVMMPNLDGLGLVRELRADERTASLPVILLSARAGEESAVEGLGSGSDDYLAKPFSARELLARVRTHVALSRMRRAWSAELERANRELEAFSYSVSHDLRAPLRRIRGFSQILAEDYGATLDADGHGHLDHIVKGVEEMSALIDGLLEMGRVTRGPLSFDTVDLSELATNAIADLRRSDPRASRYRRYRHRSNRSRRQTLAQHRAREPAWQRMEVLREDPRRPHRLRPSAVRADPDLLRPRQRRRFRYAVCRQAVRAIPAPACRDRLRRDRRGLGHRAACAGPARRSDLGGIRRRPRRDVFLHSARHPPRQRKLLSRRN